MTTLKACHLPSLVKFAAKQLAIFIRYYFRIVRAQYFALKTRRFYFAARSHCLEKGFAAHSRKSAFGTKYTLKDEDYSYICAINDHEFEWLSRNSGYVEEYNQNNSNCLAPEINDAYTRRLKRRPQYLLSSNLDDAFEYLEMRFSTRIFNDYKFSIQEIVQFTEFAKMAPSACNRQPYKLVWVQDRTVIQDILAIQGGARTFKNHVPNLIIVLSDISSILVPEEHLQPVICTSLMAMYLMVGLDLRGYGCVPLALPCNISKWGKIARLKAIKELDLHQALIPVMLIAAGKPLDTQLVPPSPRNPQAPIVV